MNSRIMTGNKSVVRVVVYALILCSLLVGCSGKKDSCEGDGTGNETISDIATDPTGTTGTTSAIIDDEETQSNTIPLDNTMPDDVFTTEGSKDSQTSVGSEPSTESTEMPPNSTDTTTSGNGGNNVPSTEPSSVPTESTAATTPENEDDNMPSYGIELPDDSWD